LGGVSALRQLWLQFHPAVGTPTCVPDLHYLITYLPWDQVLKFLFVGGSDCTKIEWTFLGLSLAAWSFICFLVLIIFSLAQLRLRTKS
jgi:disulfide bond formation protein DsbB